MARARRKEKHAPTEAQPTDTAAHREPPADHATDFSSAEAERQAAHETGHTHHTHSHQHHRREHSSHAEAVGKRPGYSPAGIIDKLAGARFREHQNPYLSVVKFEEKPSDDVRKMLADAGFQWNQGNKEWTRPIRYENAWQDRASAEDAFRDVCKAIRHERGVSHGYGSPE